MKVMFLSHMFPNNLDPNLVPFMYERAKAISKLVSLDIIAPVSYFPFFRTKKSNLEGNFKGLRLRHPYYLALPECVWSVRWLPYLRMLEEFWRFNVPKPDILHVEWIYPDACAAVRLAQKKGIKTVGVVHGNEAIDYYGPKSYRKKYIEAFHGLDRVIVVSADLKNKLINEYGVEPNKITIILNGVNVEKFPVQSKSEARRKLKIENEMPVGVCVARLSEEKNLDVLIQSIAKLKDNSPFFYVVGDGPLMVELHKLIDSYGVGGQIKLIGSVPHDDVSLWLNAADFFCLPSQREGCPVVIHEALACGKPVISTTVGAIPDLICQENYGLLCPPSDVEALANLLEKAMSRTWETEEISAYGRQFTWEKVAEQTVVVFSQLLKNLN